MCASRKCRLKNTFSFHFTCGSQFFWMVLRSFKFFCVDNKYFWVKRISQFQRHEYFDFIYARDVVLMVHPRVHLSQLGVFRGITCLIENAKYFSNHNNRLLKKDNPIDFVHYCVVLGWFKMAFFMIKTIRMDR
jgi:hypothetical protein